VIAWPPTLIQDIARRRCVIVLGAGVSMNSAAAGGRRPRGWQDFLAEGIARIVGPGVLKTFLRQLRETDPLTVCEIIKDKIGAQAFADFCREEFLNPGYAPAKIHELIHLLDSRLVLTPNFDTIYENYVAHKQGSSIVKTYRDHDIAEIIRLPERAIIKIHGTIHSAHQMIFTRTEYAAARNHYPAAYAVLSALILTHTFLFIGCGLSDPDTTLLLEDYAFQYGVGRAHYMTIPKNSVLRPEWKQVIEDTRKILLLPYDPSSGHVQLMQSIEDLVQNVQAARNTLATNQNW
jgi:hypothetical protein